MTSYRPRATDWLLGSFWVADTLALGMLAFFMVAGGVSPLETGGFALTVAAMSTVFGFHLWQLRRDRHLFQRSPVSRRARERRGF